MKKIFITVTALCAIALSSFAVETTKDSASSVPSTSQTKARIIYEGPAYAAVRGTGLVPTTGGSVQVCWTTDGCTVNGRESSTPSPITGGSLAMKTSTGLKYMNYCVSFGGERYYFQK